MRQYLYDATGRMTLGKNLENGTESAYTYNALRMCVKNTQTHPSADGFTNRETEYVPDFLSRTNNELMAYGTGAGATRTVFGHRYHRLYQNTPSGKAYFQSDIYGSPLFAADGQGAVEQYAVEQYAERDIWGILKPGTDILPGLEENMRFTTYRYDPVLGKHFALARFYDGANGRMMSKDPVKRGLNPYCYCDNDPVNYEDSTGEVLHILGASFLGGLLGAGGAALDSIVSQALNGEKIDWREVGGSAIDGGIIGAAQAGLLASGAGVPAALLVDFLAGTTGSAAKQYYVDGKIDTGESITRGLTNAVGQLPYNIKGIDKLKKLSDVGKEALKGGLAGAGEAGIRYITDHIGKDPAQVRMGTGLLPAIAGNFSPGDLLRDPKRGCGSESPFTPGLGYSSARGYRYDVPRISESKSNKASLGDFLKETALGGLMGGLAGAAFYKLVGELQPKISDRDSFDLKMGEALNKLENSGLQPGQTEISKSKVQYIVDNYNPVKAQSSIYIDSTGKYLVEGHHTTVASMILNRGSGMNMNQISPLPPSSKNVHWSKKWYEFWKTAIEVKK